MNLDDLIISMYVTFDDELKIAQRRLRVARLRVARLRVARLRVARLRQRGPLPKLADAEVLTMECVGEFLGLDCDKHLFAYFARHCRYLFPRPRADPPDHLHPDHLHPDHLHPAVR